MTEKRTKKTNSRLTPRLTAAAAALLALAAPGFRAEAATKTVAVGTQTGTSAFVPVCMNWQNSWSECVYTADMLGGIPVGSKIRSAGFMGISGTSVEGIGYRLYVSRTDASSAPSGKSDVAGFTCLYDGEASVPVSESTSVTAPLLTVGAQDDFVYEGGNLHFVVDSRVPQSGNVIFASCARTGGSSLFLSNDDWASTNSYAYDYVPVLSLEIELPAGYVDLQAATVGTDDDYDRYSPLDFSSAGAVSATLYPAGRLGIPAGSEIRGMAFRGAVHTASAGSHTVKVWMKNSDAVEIGTSLPDADDMSLVLDSVIVLDSKAGSINQWTEILRLPFSSLFRYDGGGLMVLIGLDNETTQQVYFCVNNQDTGLSLAGYGSSSADAAERPEPAPLPTTTFYYAAPQDGKPQFTLVTDKEPGEKLCVNVHSTAGFRVDWGDGNFMEYPWQGTVSANHDLYASEVKVYPLEGSEIQVFLCGGHKVTSVSVDCPALQSLSLNDNRLESIDLSGCPVLEELDLSGNRFFEFSFGSDALRSLNLARNGLEQLIITGCTALERLDVSVNALRYPIWLFWPEAPALNYLNVSFNQILELDLSGYPGLRTLICNHNGISSLDLSAVPRLETLRAGYNAATMLSPADCPGLKVLDICGLQTGDNLDLSANKALEEIDLSLTGITKADFSANGKLRRIVLSRNSLPAIDLSANVLVEHLDVSRNSLASIDISHLAKLRFLDCSRNALSSIDLSASKELDTLCCAVNNLSALSLPKGNGISCLDFSSNLVKDIPAEIGSLVYLNCADNRIEAADFSKSPALLGLDIHANLMEKDALVKMFARLPDINGTDVLEEEAWWKGVLNYNDNPGAPEVSPEVPETKGWNCSYRADILGDANAAIVIPRDKVHTRFSFAIDTKDPVYHVDWGDGSREEYRTVNPDYSYNSIAGYAAGEVIRIYAPSATELGIANAAYRDVDVSGMSMLRRLSCSGNDFSSLDLSRNPALEDLNCRNNPLTSIVFPEDFALTELDCSSTLLRSLDLAKLPKLRSLSASSCRLESLDLSAASALTQLDAYDNDIESIDLSGSPGLTELYLSKNRLSSLDLSGCPKISSLAVDFNGIVSLDLSPLGSLHMAHVNDNRLESLRIGNPALSVLLAGANRLEEIDLSGAPALTVLTLNDNRLSSLDLSGNAILNQVFAGGNMLEEVVLAPVMNELKLLNFDGNRLSSLDLSAAPALKELVVSRNMFAGTLDLSANPGITHLNISRNGIGSIKWGNGSKLESLFASYNSLGSLNVPGSSLAYVDCSRNRLEAVNFSQHKNLYGCMLDFNRLSSVNLSANTKLWGVSLRANSLEAPAIEQICSQIPDVWDLGIVPGEEGWMKKLFLSGNPGAVSADAAAAVSKGWTVVIDEEIPADRVLKLAVADAEGVPVENARLVLMVSGQDAGTPCVEASPGLYVYDPLPVFAFLSYAVRIEKEGFATKTVNADGVRDGDLSLNVVLEKGDGGAGGIGADGDMQAEYYDLQGMRLYAPEKGRPVIVRQGGKTRKAIL